MTFNEINIIDPIIKALNEKKYSNPTPIQEQTIPIALMGKDILGLAQTGTGKTAAFSIPIIQQLHYLENKNNEIKALIITPTRELAIQIGESFSDYSKYTRLRHQVIFGGVKQNAQTANLKKGTDILIATPGRLLDLMNQGFIKLNFISHFVLDEADRMLDMGFVHDIKRIISKLPQKKQSLFFSATMPKSIVSLSNSILKNPVRIEVTPVSSTVEKIEQRVFFVEKTEKKNLLIKLINERKNESILVFSRTKHGANKLAKILSKAGITSEAIHGDKSQTGRQNALMNFKSKQTQVLIATDIAARGIDVDNLEFVINYDLPNVPETYVHRIGRTGRAGNSGLAISFCSEEEKPLFKDIQKLTGKAIKVQNY